MSFLEWLKADIARTDWKKTIRGGVLLFLLLWVCSFLHSGCARSQALPDAPTAPTNLHVHVVVK